MSRPLYVIAELLATAGIANIGFLIREYLRLSIKIKTEETEAAAQKAQANRILKEKESVEQIHKNRPVSDFDTSGRL